MYPRTVNVPELNKAASLLGFETPIFQMSIHKLGRSPTERLAVLPPARKGDVTRPLVRSLRTVD